MGKRSRRGRGCRRCGGRLSRSGVRTGCQRGIRCGGSRGSGRHAGKGWGGGSRASRCRWKHHSEAEGEPCTERGTSVWWSPSRLRRFAVEEVNYWWSEVGVLEERQVTPKPRDPASPSRAWLSSPFSGPGILKTHHLKPSLGPGWTRSVVLPTTRAERALSKSS